MVFHNDFAKPEAGPADKPTPKPATSPPHVALGHMRGSASPAVAWFGPYPMKSKLTEQAAVV